MKLRLTGHFRWLLQVGLVAGALGLLVAVVLARIPRDATRTDSVADLPVTPATETAPPPMTLTPQDLIKAGYAEAEAYTAFITQQQTGVPALTLLVDRAAGLSWVQVVEKRAAQTTLVLPGQPMSETAAIDGEAIDTLVEQGYDRQDILEAASLAREHGKTTEDVLTMKASLGTWGAVQTELLREINAVQAPLQTVDEYMKGQTVTMTGLTRADVEAYVARGLTTEDLFIAESNAAAMQTTVAALLEQRAAGAEWMDLVEARRAVDPNFAQPEGFVFTQGYARRPVLTPEQVQEYAAQHVSEEDMLRAMEIAGRSATTPVVVLNEFQRQGGVWANVRLAPGSMGGSSVDGGVPTGVQ